MTVLRDVAGDALDAADLYSLLRLRAEIFVVEQRCAYLDPDGLDLLPTTRQLWITETAGSAPLCALRILAPAHGRAPWVIGRVVTRPEARGGGLATSLMRAAIATAGRPLVISAQAHLEDWYGGLGFLRDGAEHVEDGIPHVLMRIHNDPAAAVPAG